MKPREGGGGGGGAGNNHEQLRPDNRGRKRANPLSIDPLSLSPFLNVVTNGGWYDALEEKVVLGTGDYLNVCIMVAGTHSEACDESRGTKKFTGGNKICSRSAFDRENLSFFLFLFLSFLFSFSELRRGAGFLLLLLFFGLVGGMKFEDVYWIGLPREVGGIPGSKRYNFFGARCFK